MKRVMYLSLCVFFLCVGTLSITFVDAHPEMCIIVVLGLWGASGYHSLWQDECIRIRADREELLNDLYEHQEGAEHSVFVSNHNKIK